MGSLGNPILTELNRLENLLKEKERELGAVQNEIKALKGSEFLKEKAVVELNKELSKLEQKLGNAEKQIEDKNLEIKKLIGEKKAALSSQFAAESTLRRIHASQKDDDPVSAENLMQPLEAEIKMYKKEIAAFREDRKAVDRLMKSKEIALVEAEKSLNSALERSLMVENLQNLNLELRRQVEICQDENKYLEKTNRQKVVEVDKLSQTIRELEECILVAGDSANVVRHYERQVAEINEERKMLERELAKAKICANRVATVVANEWKDEGERVMPVKQWLEERKFMQSEIQRLKDKLAISERSSRAEAQLKDKFKFRLKTMEEEFTVNSDQKLKFSSPNNLQQKRSLSQPRASLAATTKSVDQRSNSQRGKLISNENVVRKSLWDSGSKSLDEVEKENIVKKINPGDSTRKNDDSEAKTNEYHVDESQTNANRGDHGNDMVSGCLYDKLQKEIIFLRKLQEEKEEVLQAREYNIKLLQRKVDALTKATDMEVKSMKRAAAVREREVLQKSEATKQQNKTINMIRRNLKPDVSTNSRTS